MARQLATRGQVLYVECPGLRAPEASSRDAWRVVRKVTRAFRPAVRVSDGLTVKTLVQWPAHQSQAIARLNRTWSRATAKWAMRTFGSRAPIAWCTVPHVAGFIGDLGARAIVYHCIDDYASLPGVDADAVRAMDDRLTRRADLVIAASRPVFESRRAINANTMLVPHGVDFDHFARARSGHLPVPVELADISGPIVGFTGLVERWIDVDLVGWLAREIPHATFVMVGRVAIPAEQPAGGAEPAVAGRAALRTAARVRGAIRCGDHPLPPQRAGARRQPAEAARVPVDGSADRLGEHAGDRQVRARRADRPNAGGVSRRTREPRCRNR